MVFCLIQAFFCVDLKTWSIFELWWIKRVNLGDSAKLMSRFTHLYGSSTIKWTLLWEKKGSVWRQYARNYFWIRNLDREMSFQWRSSEYSPKRTMILELWLSIKNVFGLENVTENHSLLRLRIRKWLSAYWISMSKWYVI